MSDGIHLLTRTWTNLKRNNKWLVEVVRENGKLFIGTASSGWFVSAYYSYITYCTNTKTYLCINHVAEDHRKKIFED